MWTRSVPAEVKSSVRGEEDSENAAWCELLHYLAMMKPATRYVFTEFQLMDLREAKKSVFPIFWYISLCCVKCAKISV